MIAQTIQLALAPVFVLVAIGNIMNLLSTRLGRIVDRSRVLQERYNHTEGSEHDEVVREIRLLDRRIATIGRAVLLMVLSALSIGCTVTALFLDGFLHADMQRVAAIGFIVAIALMMVALWLFLLETRMASAHLRVPEEFLERERTL
ncbi:MAG: DUF2721 domain-containing protein [Sphingomonadales bacterium]|nr:DUF2721 domain-containing protein [Sphingomonadales bacterium]MBD3772001.1 DUF2721 domain-containing protein [Paracoccaceae bacterium]MBD3813934.1 DUF2721 domain-containing protein [Betaproteobacteria bacterium]